MEERGNYASVNSSGAPIPPPGNRRAFAYVVCPGSWALAYPRATPGYLTHVFSKDGRVYRERGGLCKSQSFPPKESSKCINLRGKPYIVFIFLRERKQGVFGSKKRRTVPLCRNDGTS